MFSGSALVFFILVSVSGTTTFWHFCGISLYGKRVYRINYRKETWILVDQ
jgi:hypothetical protein